MNTEIQYIHQTWIELVLWRDVGKGNMVNIHNDKCTPIYSTKYQSDCAISVEQYSMLKKLEIVKCCNNAASKSIYRLVIVNWIMIYGNTVNISNYKRSISKEPTCKYVNRKRVYYMRTLAESIKTYIEGKAECNMCIESVVPGTGKQVNTIR
jgi:hypothetical protein